MSKGDYLVGIKRPVRFTEKSQQQTYFYNIAFCPRQPPCTQEHSHFTTPAHLLIIMRSILAFVLLAMSTGSVIASPVNVQGLQARSSNLQQRNIFWNPLAKRQGGSATTGNAGSANGGDVTQDAGPGGTISNDDGSGKHSDLLVNEPVPYIDVFLFSHGWPGRYIVEWYRYRWTRWRRDFR